MTKVDWIKNYRNSTGCTIMEATKAWKKHDIYKKINKCHSFADIQKILKDIVNETYK